MSKGFDTVDRVVYGAVEQAGLMPGEQQRLLDEIRDGGDQQVYWSDPRLARIVRMRFLTDPSFPMLDHSYIYGRLTDGTLVRVDVPFYQLPKRGWKGALIDFAKRDKVYLKRLGVFDEGTVSILWG